MECLYIISFGAHEQTAVYILRSGDRQADLCRDSEP